MKTQVTRVSKIDMPEYRVELYQDVHTLHDVLPFDTRSRDKALSVCKDWVLRDPKNRALLMAARRGLWTRRFHGYELEREFYGSTEAYGGGP